MGFAVDGRAWVVPTAFARIDDHVYLHGAVGNFFLRTLAGGAEACVTVPLLDGLVLARSAFHHSMNYRSVVIFGHAEAVTGEDEKHAALLAILEHMVPGRSSATRLPTVQELRSTLVVHIPIDEAADYELPHWAGVVPHTVVRGEPQSDVVAGQSGC